MSTPVLHFSAQARAGVHVDLEKLVAGRLLVQGSSGAGKSWLVRYVLEQTHGRIQQFVFDPEGELVTLREKLDYVVVSGSEGGDVRADPDTADMLCRKLVEAQASAIFDLNELDPEDREEFVAKFLHRLINLPKELWRSALVVVDEAHEFAPEAGQPASRKPMELLVSKGRKRGLCAVFCTQRLSKLSKNASDLQNILVGYTGLDTDVKRAGEILGFDKDQREELKRLEFEFFAFGPALSREVIRVKSGPIQTHHPKPGELRAPTPPARGKLLELVAQLEAIPDRAAEEERTVEGLELQVRQLERELRQKDFEGHEAPPGWVSPAEVDQRVAEAAQEAEDRAREEWEEISRARVEEAVSAFRSETSPAVEVLQRVILNGWEPPEPAAPTPRALRPAPAQSKSVPPAAAAPPRARPAPALRTTAPAAGGLGLGERQILTAVAQHPNGVTREQLSVLTGYKRSSRDTYLQKLGARGLIVQDMGTIRASDAGMKALGPDFERLPTGDRLREYWLGRLPQGERVVLEAVIAGYPDPVDRDAISESTGYKRSSRDTYLQKLGARRLVISDRAGVRAADELFTRRVRR